MGVAKEKSDEHSMKQFFRNAALAVLFLCCCFVPFDARAGKFLELSKDGYCLYVPTAAENAKQVPVLIALAGKDVEPSSDIQLWQTEAEKKGFFVIDFKVDYGQIKDDSDIRRLHERISDKLGDLFKIYHFDRHEVYIAGTSAGAVISLALSLRFPNAYQTVGLVGGGGIHYPSQDYLINARKIQFFIVHGKNDPTITIDKVYATKSTLEKNGAQVLLKVIPYGEHSLAPLAYQETVNWFNEVYESPLRRFTRLVRHSLNL